MEDFNILPNEAQRIGGILAEIAKGENELLLELIHEDRILSEEYAIALINARAKKKPGEKLKARDILKEMVCSMSVGTPEQREQLFELFPED